MPDAGCRDVSSPIAHAAPTNQPRLELLHASEGLSLLADSRKRRIPIQKAPRSVVGYHGTSRRAAAGILADQRLLPSSKTYDWLGEGVYFWEYAPYRALDWAVRRCAREGGEPAVIRATVRLGRCLNLLDSEHIPGLTQMYDSFAEAAEDVPLPQNTARGAHFLDRRVIDAYCRAVDRRSAIPFQTVRGSFAEGNPIYPGSKVLTKAHTQIAVRDAACILRASLVQFT